MAYGQYLNAYSSALSSVMRGRVSMLFAGGSVTLSTS